MPFQSLGMNAEDNGASQKFSRKAVIVALEDYLSV